jgi:hypothetical protein
MDLYVLWIYNVKVILALIIELALLVHHYWVITVMEQLALITRIA